MGNVKKWIHQFSENDMMFYMLDISSPSSFWNQFKDFQYIVKSVTVKLCYFIFIFGLIFHFFLVFIIKILTFLEGSKTLLKLEQTQPNFGEQFPGYSSNIVKYIREKITGTIVRKNPVLKEDFIFIEQIENSIEIDPILKNCQKVVIQEEGERLLNVAQV